MIDTQQYIKINIRGEISIIVGQEKRYMHINVHTKCTLTHIYMVCNRNQYWVLSSRSAKSWNNIKIFMLNHGL